MRVLLINPFYPISETPSPPLGLAYLAAALEEAGAEVRVLDLVVHPYSAERLAELIADFKPHLAGATAVTMTVYSAMEVLAEVKRIDPRIVTAMGGPHVSFTARETLDACPALDIAVIGEGEDTIVALAQAAASGREVAGIHGTACRTGGAIHIAPRREFIAPLDRLPPPARHLLPLGRYRALGMPISMTTSRGCPHQCIFCVGRKMVGARVRYRSPERVVDEIEALSRLGFHQVNIADDLFTAAPHHCLAVCDEIRRRGVTVKWTSFARVDTVSEEILSRMKAAGCTAVSFGVESANRGILKTIKKRITPEQVAAAVAMCARTGVTPFASFILGLPGETPATMRESMDFGRRLKELGLLYGFHLLAPFPGTEVRDRSQALGLRILTDDWSQYHANRAVVETPAVSREMLDAVAIEWETSYNRFLGEIRERMRRGAATAEEAYELTNLERIVAVYDLMMGREIETRGSWRAEAGETGAEPPLERLVSRVCENGFGRRPEVRAAIVQAAADQTLVCHRQGDRVEWRWREAL